MVTYVKKIFYDIYVDVALIISGFLYASISSEHNAWFICGAILMWIAIILWIIARIQLGNAFSVAPQARSLAMRGLYSKIRHPMYIFSFLAVVGVVVMMQNKYLILILIILAVVQLLRMRMENALLKKTYGSAYDEYMKKTWI